MKNINIHWLLENKLTQLTKSFPLSFRCSTLFSMAPQATDLFSTINGGRIKHDEGSKHPHKCLPFFKSDTFYKGY